MTFLVLFFDATPPLLQQGSAVPLFVQGVAVWEGEAVCRVKMERLLLI